MLHNQVFSKDQVVVYVDGKPYKKHVILDDVNIPYKLAIDRNNNKLFFCINADEFSDQSFHSVILDLDRGVSSIIPSIRNGFASAVDQTTCTVYLGGSDGIYKFDYATRDIEIPAVISGIDIFDMFFHNHLYFVDTTNQDIFVCKDMSTALVAEVKGRFVHHFALSNNGDLVFMSSMGLFILPKGACKPIFFEHVDHINVRGATTDVNGIPHLIAQDGIYSVDVDTKQLTRILPLENGYGLAFDIDNNIIYSDQRTVNKLIPC